MWIAVLFGANLPTQSSGCVEAIYVYSTQKVCVFRRMAPHETFEYAIKYISVCIWSCKDTVSTTQVIWCQNWMGMYYTCIAQKVNSECFGNWDRVCLLRGTNWILNYNSRERQNHQRRCLAQAASHSKSPGAIPGQTSGGRIGNGTGSSPSASVFSRNTIPPLLQTHFRLVILLSEGQAGEASETSK